MYVVTANYRLAFLCKTPMLFATTVCLMSPLHGKNAFTRYAPDLMEQARTDLYRIFSISDPPAETFTVTFKDLSGI